MPTTTTELVQLHTRSFAQKLITLRNLDYLLQQKDFGRLAHPSIEDPQSLLRSAEMIQSTPWWKQPRKSTLRPHSIVYLKLWQTVESSGEHFLAESDEIRRLRQIKMFVTSIVLTRGPAAGLNFIDNKSSAILPLWEIRLKVFTSFVKRFIPFW